MKRKQSAIFSDKNEVDSSNWQTRFSSATQILYVDEFNRQIVPAVNVKSKINYEKFVLGRLKEPKLIHEITKKLNKLFLKLFVNCKKKVEKAKIR